MIKVQNVLVSENGEEISVQWDYEQPNVCLYNIYLDGTLITQTNNQSYAFEDSILTSCQGYSISVAAVSSSGVFGVPTVVEYEKRN